MDRSSARNSLEMIGDLFLTNENSDAAAPDTSQSTDEEKETASQTGDTTMDKPTQSAGARSMLDGPRPVRLKPKSSRPTPPGSPATQKDEEHPLAQTLRLVGMDDDHDDHVRSDDTATKASEPAAPARFEAVFLGNLPGFGGPWLVQYAHHLACKDGRPVAIIHIDEDQFDLELVGNTAQRGEVDALSIPLTTASKEGLVDRIDRLLEELPEFIGGWLVHMPMPLDETAVTMARDVPRCALVSGTDNMAVIGAYQWVKDLLGGFETIQPQIGVMFMGSDEAAAKTAADKLSQTAKQYLQTPLIPLGSRKAMAPAYVKQIGCFANEPGTWNHLVALLSDYVEMDPFAEDEATIDELQTEAIATAQEQVADDAIDVTGAGEQSQQIDEDDLPLDELLSETQFSRDIAEAEPLTEEETQILLGALADVQQDEIEPVPADALPDDALSDEVDETVEPKVVEQAEVEPATEIEAGSDADEDDDTSDALRAFIQRLKSTPGTITSMGSPASQSRQPSKPQPTPSREPMEPVVSSNDDADEDEDIPPIRQKNPTLKPKIAADIAQKFASDYKERQSASQFVPPVQEQPIEQPADAVDDEPTFEPVQIDESVESVEEQVTQEAPESFQSPGPVTWQSTSLDVQGVSKSIDTFADVELTDEQLTTATAIAEEPIAAQAKPMPADESVVAVEEDANELSLAQFIPGSVRLAARCPQQPDTELILDEAGRLHLLAQHETIGDRTLHQTYLDLLEARNWVSQHVELLQMTQRQLRFDIAASPKLHLFTDCAREAIAMNQKLDGSLHTHLLQKVVVGSESTWFSTPLS